MVEKFSLRIFGAIAYNTAGPKKPLRLAQEFTGLTAAL